MLEKMEEEKAEEENIDVVTVTSEIRENTHVRPGLSLADAYSRSNFDDFFMTSWGEPAPILSEALKACRGQFDSLVECGLHRAPFVTYLWAGASFQNNKAIMAQLIEGTSQPLLSSKMGP